MKSLTRVLLALFLAGTLNADFCLRPLMNAYQLDGLLEPNQQRNPLCPTIRNNCCTQGDILKVYDKYSNYLLPKLLEYKDKYQKTLKLMMKLHARVVKMKERLDLRGNQKLFCNTAFQNVTSFDFQNLIEDLNVGHMQAYDYFLKVHTGFMCVFCDYDAHDDIVMSTRAVGVDTGVCLDALNNLKDFLITQNIRLVRYFRRVQKFLDCSLYDDKFNLPFAFGEQDMLRLNFRECFKKLTPDSLDPLCAPLCDQLQFGAISPVFEGQVFFMRRAISFFHDQIRSVEHKIANTPFDPVLALQQLNMARDKIAFNTFGNKTAEREAFMNRTENQWDQASSGNAQRTDDIFRNDLTPYPSTAEQDNMDRLAEANPSMLQQLNREGWDKYYRDVFNPGRAPQFLNQGGQNQGGQYQSGQNQRGQNQANGVGGQLGNAAAGRNSNLANLNTAGTSLLGGLTTQWRARVLKRTHKNAHKVRKMKTAESSAAPKKHKHQTKRKMKHGTAHKKQKKSIRKATTQPQPKFFITGDHKAAKKGKKRVSKKRVAKAKGPTAADVLEKDAIKTLLGKKDVPEKEEKLLEKMAKIIDTEFTAQNAKKKASRKAAKRHVRLLEELLGDSSEHIGVPKGRILQAPKVVDMNVDPKIALNPIKYYNAYYESIDFYLNSTSKELCKPLMNTPDLTLFNRTYIFNQGVNIRSYLENLGFDMTQAALTMQLRGQNNADKPDPNIPVILNATDQRLSMAVMQTLTREYIIVVNPDHMSENDQQLLKLTPTYEQSESFEVISKRYFDDDFIFHLRDHLPHAFIRRKPMKIRSPRSLSEVRATPATAEIFRELNQSIRPARLLSDRHPRKDLF